MPPKRIRRTSEKRRTGKQNRPGRPLKTLDLDNPKTLSELSGATGISYTTLTRMRRNGQIQARSDGTWDLELIKQTAKLRAERLLPDGPPSKGSSRLLNLKNQHLEAATKLKQISVARLAGKLVPWDDIVQEWNQKVMELNSRLKGFGRDLSPQLENKTIFERERIITDHLRTVLDPLLVGPTKKPVNTPARSAMKKRTG